jgi:hypothetical protein
MKLPSRATLSAAASYLGMGLILVATLARPTASQPAGQKPSPPPAAATPPPAGAAPATPAAEAPAVDLDRLRAEHGALKDALFRSRARRQVLENALLSTQLIPVIHWEGARRYLLKAAELRLDGVRIWDAGSAPLGDSAVTLAARGVPPGGHVLGVRLEVRSRENPKLGYTSEQSFAVTLPEGKKTTVEITIDEDGDPPSYNPDIEIEIDTD